jgi:hypothetical protein
MVHLNNYKAPQATVPLPKSLHLTNFGSTSTSSIARFTPAPSGSLGWTERSLSESDVAATAEMRLGTLPAVNRIPEAASSRAISVPPNSATSWKEEGETACSWYKAPHKIQEMSFPRKYFTTWTVTSTPGHALHNVARLLLVDRSRSKERSSQEADNRAATQVLQGVSTFSW